MALSDTRIYCQNCRAANALSETHCLECGTRLLLVVFPNSLQYDTNQTPTFYEDHLLERVSILELRQAQLSEALRSAVEVLRDQAEILKEEKDLIRTLFRLMTDSSRPEARQDPDPQDVSGRAAGPFAEILNAHDGTQSEMFGKLLADAAEAFEGGNEKRAFRLLDRAALVSPRNFPLHLEMARRLFRAEHFAAAEARIASALELEPHSVPAILLSGVLAADAGNADTARKRLGLLSGDATTGGLVNFVWGMLAASEGKWTESIAAFKQSGSRSESPEIDYLIGSAYYHLGRFPMAIRHLRQATRADSEYRDAWFMQSVVARIAGDAEGAAESLERAFSEGEPSPQCVEFLREGDLGAVRTALAFRHFETKNRRVLSGGSRRLARFLGDWIERVLDRAE